MSPHERRLKIVEELQNRRRDTYSNLAFEFSVSKRTIQYDVEILSCFYPIETISGKGGGVKLADWYRPNRKNLTPKQTALLNKLKKQLKGDELKTLNSILFEFAQT